MTRNLLKLTPRNRETAIRWIDRAIRLGAEAAWTMEVREAKRTDDQNAALWGLIGQILKLRPYHYGVKMTAEHYKAVFMQAWGAEVVFLPNLDGQGMFPAGHRSSQLTKAEFSDLIELILAWCAREGLPIRHFGDVVEDAA